MVRLDGDFLYGQWRYQLVGACPRDLTGNRLASVGDSRGERCESVSTKFQLVTGSRAAACGPRSFSVCTGDRSGAPAVVAALSTVPRTIALSDFPTLVLELACATQATAVAVALRLLNEPGLRLGFCCQRGS